MSSDNYANTVAVRLTGVSKTYTLYDSPADRLKQLLFPKRRYGQAIAAVGDVSLEINRGETFGLVGRNGAGKSTLLQLISGIFPPTAGTVEVFGTVAPLLQLGAGFNPDFTGRENAKLHADLFGIAPAELAARLPEIMAFADIGDFFDRPVKTYSSGMFARLAFAVATAFVPEILIVDEIIAVGDAKFQARCFARIAELKARGTTIILVTHSTEQIVAHCDRAALLDGGRLLAVGAPLAVTNQYMTLLYGADRTRADGDSAGGTAMEAGFDAGIEDLFGTRNSYNQYEHRWGDGRALLLDYQLASGALDYPLAVASGATIALTVKALFRETIDRPIYGLNVKTREGVMVYGTNSELQGVMPPAGVAGSVQVVRFDMPLTLFAGDYFISIGLASADGTNVVPHDRRYDSVHIQVTGPCDFHGQARLDLAMNIL